MNVKFSRKITINEKLQLLKVQYDLKFARENIERIQVRCEWILWSNVVDKFRIENILTSLIIFPKADVMQ